MLRNSAKAYPVYAVSYDASLKATYKTLKDREISGDATLKTQIKDLREKLSAESINVENKLKTALLGLQTTPCSDLARTKFWEVLQQTTENGYKLDKLNTDLRAAGTASPALGVENIRPLMAIPHERREASSVLRSFQANYRMIK